MEKELIATCKEVFTQSKGVKGVLAMDCDGLCLFSEGFSDENIAGPISSIASLAVELESVSRSSPISRPVIEIGTDKGKLLISTRKSITTAIFKSKE